MLFPGQRLSLPEALERARAMNLELRELALERRITLVGQRPEWYGFDPIHIRRRCFARAYSGILKHRLAGAPEERPLGNTSIRRWLRLLLLAPQYQPVFGFDRYRKQPGAVLPHGSTVSLY